ncbi:hypothetical protein [Streptomyces sp. NPDC002215]|uniref:hypothetical protein n=1 Tax=Streptomyces sp. NPDC002215 TaxID=3154412 RepID=UPI00332BB129
MPRTLPAQPHPLAEYEGRIDPAKVYTLRQLAELMELAPSSLSGMARYGWLPGSRMRPHRRGGRTYTWTGKQLVRLAARTIRVEYDHEQYSAATLYRVGCRCPACKKAHSAATTERKRALSGAAFTEEQRNRVVELVSGQMPVAEAAAEVGVTLAQVYGRAVWDADFADRLDEAAWSLCVLGEDDPSCSLPSAYRGKKTGPTPRAACRGTGCREWRRAQARQERAAA